MQKIESIFLFIILVTLFFTNSVLLPAEDNPAFAFTWAFIIKSEDGTMRGMKVEQTGIDIVPGECFKIYAKADTSLLVYIILIDSSENLYPLLYPAQSGEEQQQENEVEFFIPEQEQIWGTVDEKSGEEKFYLLISDQNLEKLEDLCNQYESLLSLDNQNTEKGLNVKFDIIQEMKRLQKEHSSLVGPGESQVSIAGNIRGLEKEIEGFAIMVDVDSFYARIIRINH